MKNIAIGSLLLVGCAGDATGMVAGGSTSAEEGETAGEMCVAGETRPCYSGPPGSDAVAPCHAGTQRCTDATWGVCEGERLPDAADCETPGDESCGTAPRCPGEPLWSRAFAGEEVVASALVVEPGGDLYIAGGFSDTLQLEPPMAAKTPRDTFLIRLRPDGERVWGRRFGGGAGDEVGLYLDADGDLRLTVRCAYVIDLGNGKLTGTFGDPAIARITPEGTTRWSRRIVGLDSPLYAAPGQNGEMWLAGGLDGVVDLGDGPVAHPGWSDVLLLALSPEGEILRSAHYGDLGEQHATAVAVAPDGDVVLAGEFNGSLDFGDGPLYSGGHGDVFVARLTSDLTPRWALSFPALGLQYAKSVIADAHGVALAGYYYQGFDLGGGQLSELIVPGPFEDTELAPQGFLAAFDPTGQYRWSRQLGVTAASTVSAVRVGPGEGYVLTGAAAAAATLGGVQLGVGDGKWLAVFEQNGTIQWHRSFGGDPLYWASPVPASTGDSVFVTLGGSGVHDFGAGPLGADGEASLFVAAFAQ